MVAGYVSEISKTTLIKQNVFCTLRIMFSADATADAGADATADSTDSKKTWIFKSFSRIT